MTLKDCMSRKEGGSGLTSLGDSVDTSIRQLKAYIKKKQKQKAKKKKKYHKQTKNKREPITELAKKKRPDRKKNP